MKRPQGGVEWLHDPLPCEILGVALLRRQCSDQERYLTKAYYQSYHAQTLAALRRLAAQRPNVRLIVPGDGLCQHERCITDLNGEPLYRDDAHLRRNLSEETNRELAHLIGLDGIFQ